MPSGKTMSQDAVDIIRYMHEYHKLSYGKIGDLIGRSKNYIGRILERCDPITGERHLAKKGRRAKTSGEDDLRIRELALANPYIGVEGVAKLFNETSEKKLSKSSVHRRLKALGINAVKVPASGEHQDRKLFPKSQTVYRFEPVPEKKKRKLKKKQSESTPEDQCEAGPSTSSSEPILPQLIPAPSEIVNAGPDERTVSIVIFNPGMPPIHFQPSNKVA